MRNALDAVSACRSVQENQLWNIKKDWHWQIIRSG